MSPIAWAAFTVWGRLQAIDTGAVGSVWGFFPSGIEGATVKRRLRFIAAVVGWWLLLLAGMTVAGRPRLDLVVVGGALGLLALSELAAPVGIQPEWQRRFRWIRLAAVLLALAVIAPRVYDLVAY